MKSKIPTFYQHQLPNRATHCNQAECGFSIYRGVLVQWDEDHDTQVLTMLDNMPGRVVDQLAVVQEHKGTISFVWKRKIPTGYEEGLGVEQSDGYWAISDSKVLHPRQIACNKQTQ